VLLEWWKENDPELIEIVAEAVEKGFIELIGGGYYEPILASIPREDRLKQLGMLNSALKKLFGKYPSGAWIAERIWQPDIINDLKESGLNYAFLDDFQFFQAGMPAEKIDNIFRTEYGGEYLDVFPIHERLRYKIPFAEPCESLNEILYLNGRYSKLSVMFDDGEKMGGWPNTYEWVYGKNGNKGWLENFIREANSNNNYSGIKFELPSDILSDISNTFTEAKIPVYLPISSYREMGEWTLAPQKRLIYEEIRDENPSAPLSGGIWHNFLTKYPEANLHHKRMLNLSRKINYTARANSKCLEEPVNELLKSQANDAYWHGVFGGIYLPHLRRGIHKALISSYRLYKEAIKEPVEKEYFDFDSDGEKEISLSNEFWWIVYKPSAGSFSALDYIEKDMLNSLGDVFCLHEEYDILTLKKNSFNNCEVSACEEDDEGGNGINEAQVPPSTIHKEPRCLPDLTEQELSVCGRLLPSFEIMFNGGRIHFKGESIKEDKGKNYIGLNTSGYLNGETFIDLNININKSLEFIINSKPKSAGNLDIVFRFAFPGGDGPATNIDIEGDVMGLNNYINKELQSGAVNTVHLSDYFWGGKINLKERTETKLLKKYNIIFMPLTTVSLSENGYERIFQGVEFKYRFNLTTEEYFSSIIVIDVENISRDPKIADRNL
jgi:hypothetical protein